MSVLSLAADSKHAAKLCAPITYTCGLLPSQTLYCTFKCGMERRFEVPRLPPPHFSKYTAAGSVLRQGVAAVPSYTSCGATFTIKPPPISAAMLSFTLAWCSITARLPTYLLILESSYASSAKSAPASPVAVSTASSCLAERARSSVCSSSCSSSCDGRPNATSSPQRSEMA